MKAGRISFDGHFERDRLEEAQVILAEVSMDLDEISLRIRQAIRRTSMVHGVLEPAYRHLELARADIAKVQVDLGEAWRERQKKRWRK